MIIKPWGMDHLLHINNNIQINRIQINKGGECSKHYHSDKNNIFYVISGTLLIEIWDDDKPKQHILRNSDSIEIPHKTYHKFTAIEPTEALEIYYIHKNIDLQDIVRDTN
jgi:mannose-6-phosphate isomerase-like protein (cupin superfamily)